MESQYERYVAILTEACQAGGRCWEVYKAAATKKAATDANMAQALRQVEAEGLQASTAAALQQGIEQAQRNKRY